MGEITAENLQDVHEPFVFLGGTWNEDPWRDVLTEKLDMPYFDPIVEDWNEEARQREEEAKEQAAYNLFVVTSSMQGVFSIAEVVDLSNKEPETTVLTVCREGFSEGELKSLYAVAELVEGNGATTLYCLDVTAVYLNCLYERWLRKQAKRGSDDE